MPLRIAMPLRRGDYNAGGTLNKTCISAKILSMSVTFRVEKFEGPLDLLLQLVEENELDISSVSLATVAEQFVEHIRNNPKIPLDELADFLVVAAKLMYLKSKLLLPDLSAPELEEGPSLEEQLRRYREFVELSKLIDAAWVSGVQSFPRMQRPMRLREVAFLPPPGVTAESLQDVMRRVISRLEPLLRLPQASLERVVTIQEMIGHLFRRVSEVAKTSFRTFVGKKAGKAEIVVSFLALLELVKQKFVRVGQQELFQDIDIETHPDAPSADPLAHSYL